MRLTLFPFNTSARTVGGDVKMWIFVDDAADHFFAYVFYSILLMPLRVAWFVFVSVVFFIFIPIVLFVSMPICQMLDVAWQSVSSALKPKEE